MSDSIDSLREAVRALPENTALRRQLAHALEAAGELTEAAEHLEAICRAAPADAAARERLARLLGRLGRHREALERYDQAVALDVGRADAAWRDELLAAIAAPRSRLRLVADGAERPPPAPAPDAAAGPPEITFSDVGGLDEVKEKIRMRILHPLTRPELYRAFGKRVGGGLLFYGPPGCGKTFLARATAGEAKIHFIAVGIDEVLDMWLGQSEKRLHELFEQARAQAPSILFFDEVDALGGRRAGLRHESYRTLVTQFLSELDGAKGRTEGVLVLGATNAPWDVDMAFRRPGRFGEILFVPPPDLRARVEILKLKLKGKPTADLDVPTIARATELYSGADLEHLVDLAIEAALGDSLRGGAIRPLTQEDLSAAAGRMRPSTIEWFASAKGFATYANDSGQYDDVLAFIARHRL